MVPKVPPEPRANAITAVRSVADAGGDFARLFLLGCIRTLGRLVGAGRGIVGEHHADGEMIAADVVEHAHLHQLEFGRGENVIEREPHEPAVGVERVVKPAPRRRSSR